MSAAPEAVHPQWVARRIAAFRLVPGREDGDPITIPERSWPLARGALVGEGLTGLAVAAVGAGVLRLESNQVSDLLGDHRDAMLLCLSLERELLRVCSALHDAGIGALVLKGPALAHTRYPQASWRSFRDIDLLVRSADWARACNILHSLGFPRVLPEPRHGFDLRFGKAAVHRSEVGLEIDLHRTLVLGPFGLWMKPEELFELTADFPLGGLMLSRLDDSGLLLNAAVHAALGWSPPLLMPLRDVAQIAWSGNVDWDAVHAWVSRWRLQTVPRPSRRPRPRLRSPCRSRLGGSWPGPGGGGRSGPSAPTRRAGKEGLEQP
jgi:hypothetical protein